MLKLLVAVVRHFQFSIFVLVCSIANAAAKTNIIESKIKYNNAFSVYSIDYYLGNSTKNAYYKPFLSDIKWMGEVSCGLNNNDNFYCRLHSLNEIKLAKFYQNSDFINSGYTIDNSAWYMYSGLGATNPNQINSNQMQVGIPYYGKLNTSVFEYLRENDLFVDSIDSKNLGLKFGNSRIGFDYRY